MEVISMKKYNFSAKELDLSDFFHAYAPVAKTYEEFVSCENSINNHTDGNSKHSDIFAYPFMTLLTREKFGSGVSFSTKCSFEHFGAPLLVIVEDAPADENGIHKYGEYYEVVAYDKGLNIWKVLPWPERVERPIKAQLLGKVEFPIADGDIAEVNMKIEGKSIIGTVNGHTLKVDCDTIPDSFHIGLTACEGYNDFYEFTID
jgi:hypothetical protein